MEGLVTSRVLTMEYVGGTKITEVSPVVLMDVDATGLAADLFAAYLEQILIHGFFHADPHPGNVLLTPDGRLALLDLGMTARVPPRLQVDTPFRLFGYPGLAIVLFLVAAAGGVALIVSILFGDE